MLLKDYSSTLKVFISNQKMQIVFYFYKHFFGIGTVQISDKKSLMWAF